MSEKLTFSLVENAHDFIISAVDDARKEDSRSWKYSLLNLSSGLELILKARLYMEHWSLLFANIDKATKEKMKHGNFVSVDFERTLARLHNIARVNLPMKMEKDLRAIRGMRNKIRGCEINCVNGHRIVKLFSTKGILWLTERRNN